MIMQPDFVQAGSFELDGLSEARNVPLLAMKVVYKGGGSTEHNVGCGNKGYVAIHPTPLSLYIDGIEIKFAESEKTESLIKWCYKNTSTEDRDFKDEEVSVIGYDKKRNETSRYEVEGCYADNIQDEGYDSQSNQLHVYSVTLRGRKIKKEK